LKVDGEAVGVPEQTTVVVYVFQVLVCPLMFKLVAA
jgi:hypothetical protein